MPTWGLGMNAKIYFGEEGDDLAEMDEMSNVTNVTLTTSPDEAPMTTRANAGWKATAATLRECAAEFEMIDDPDDAGFAAVEAAHLVSGTLHLAVLTGDRDVSASKGPKGDFSVVGFVRNEPLDGVIMVNVSVKLAVWDQWIVVA